MSSNSENHSNETQRQNPNNINNPFTKRDRPVSNLVSVKTDNHPISEPGPGFSTPNLNKNTKRLSMEIPTSGTSPMKSPVVSPRRSRGMSLRSQLLNKKLENNLRKAALSPENSHNDDYSENIELATIPSNLSGNSGTSGTSGLSATSGSTTAVNGTGAPSVSRGVKQKVRRKSIGSMKKQAKTYSIARFIDNVKFSLGLVQTRPTKEGRKVPLGLYEFDSSRFFGKNPTFKNELHTDTIKYLQDELVDERNGRVFVKNQIRSSRYSLVNFLPKQLYAQFSKVANIYFMTIAIMQLIPNWSTTGTTTTIIPLSIFIAISMAREGIDDLRRHAQDKEENNKITQVILYDPNEASKQLKESRAIARNSTNSHTSDMSVNSVTKLNEDFTITSDDEDSRESLEVGTSENNGNTTNSFARTDLLNKENLYEEQTYWKDLKVGRIIKLKQDEPVPADIVLLTSDNTNSEVFVETMDLDGETNLKTKLPHPQLHSVCNKVSGLSSIDALVTSEDPNPNLYKFEGHLVFQNKKYALTSENVVYRGSIIRNTNNCLGLIIFTGEESKIRMNAIKNPRTKAPHLQSTINKIVMFMITLVISLSVGSFATERVLKSKHQDTDWYLFSKDVGAMPTFMSFIIMYNTLIPLSLYVTMEIIKVSQLVLLQYDIDLYHAETNTPAEAKTATILEELGQVSYVFSDKTGTLTDNMMIFRKFSVSGTTWDDTQYSDLFRFLSTHPDSTYAQRMRFFMLSLALCHTCFPKRNNDTDIEYQSSSPDELALVQAASEMGYIVYDKRSNILCLKTYPNGMEHEPVMEQYEILDVIEFNSVRKRMSCIVKFPNGNICLLCKGADNVILERLESAYNTVEVSEKISKNSKLRKEMEADLIISERNSRSVDLFRNDSIVQSITRASLSRNRSPVVNEYMFDDSSRVSTELDKIAESSRRSLHIDQKKRYGVPDSADQTQAQLLENEALLMNEQYILEKTLEHIEEYSTNGLRTLLYGHRWLSEQEYAEFSKEYHIAKTALVDREEKMAAAGEKLESGFTLSGATAIEDKLQEGVPDAIDKLHRAGIKMWMLTGDKRETAINIGYSCGLIKNASTVVILSSEDDDESGLVSKMEAAVIEIKSGSVAHCVAVVDGHTLQLIEKDLTTMNMFIEFGCIADAVVCCRASPAQKAKLVDVVKDKYKDQVTLAIGDGANDIAMIQSADIGIGITGKEGLQAARSSDYSIAQFRFLIKLLLVHGRYNYVRVTKFILFTFYKEVMFYLAQAIYQRKVRFTGTSLFEPWSLSMYNTLFASLPALVIGIFEKDLRPATLIANPVLYRQGRENLSFNWPIFAYWLVIAAGTSILLVNLSWLIWGQSALRDNTIMPMGVMLYIVIIILVNVKCQILEMRNRNVYAFASVIIEILGVILWNYLISGLYKDETSLIYRVKHGITEEFGTDYTWWAALFALLVLGLLIDIILKTLRNWLFPTATDYFQEFEKNVDLRLKFEKLAYNELKQSWEWPRDKSFQNLRNSKFGWLFRDSKHDATKKKDKKLKHIDIGDEEFAEGMLDKSKNYTVHKFPSGKIYKKRLEAIEEGDVNEEEEEDDDEYINRVLEQRQGDEEYQSSNV